MNDATMVRGVPMVLYPPPDYLADVVRRTGDFFEAAILDEIARRVTGGVLIDVGAMVGNHSVYLAEFVAHTRIHAFEPEPGNAELLAQNTARYPTVEVHRMALGAQEGSLVLGVDPYNRGHCVPLRDQWWMEWPSRVQVPLTTLDSYGFEDVALIKIDVEGYEPEVLAGARETIARCHPLIVVEDWEREYGRLLPNYYMAAQWERSHQTYLYAHV